MGSRRLGQLEQLLMFAVLRLGDRAHGLAIRREVEAHGGGRVSPGAVYTTMARLEDRGLVRSRLSDERPEGGGRRRRFYRLEPEGARTLREAYGALESLAGGATDRLAELGGPDRVPSPEGG